MNRKSFLYIKTTAVLTLALYLGFFIIAVLHVHQYNFQTQILFETANSSDTCEDPFLDSQSNCRLVEFLYIYYSSSNFYPADFLILPQTENICIETSDGFYSSTKILTHLLRAPPLV